MPAPRCTDMPRACRSAAAMRPCSESPVSMTYTGTLPASARSCMSSCADPTSGPGPVPRAGGEAPCPKVTRRSGALRAPLSRAMPPPPGVVGRPLAPLPPGGRPPPLPPRPRPAPPLPLGRVSSAARRASSDCTCAKCRNGSSARVRGAGPGKRSLSVSPSGGGRGAAASPAPGVGSTAGGSSAWSTRHFTCPARASSAALSWWASTIMSMTWTKAESVVRVKYWGSRWSRRAASSLTALLRTACHVVEAVEVSDQEAEEKFRPREADEVSASEPAATMALISNRWTVCALYASWRCCARA